MATEQKVKYRNAWILLGVLLAGLFSAGCPQGPVQTPFGPIDLPLQGYEMNFPGPYETEGYAVQFDTTYSPIFVLFPSIEPPEGGLPVVLFNVAWNQPKATYLGYATQLAQWGYVAVIRSQPTLGIWFIGNDMMERHVAEQSAILDWLEGQNVNPESPLYGMADADNAGAIGHSFGNGPTINAAVTEPRIRAAVTLDATQVSWEQDWRAIAESGVAFMYIGVDEGGWCSQPIGLGPRLLDVSNPPAMEVIIAGGDHLDFMEDMYGLVFVGQFGCGLGTADSQDVRDIAQRYLISWFNVQLKGLSEFEAYYSGASSEEDEVAGLVFLDHKL